MVAGPGAERVVEALRSYAAADRPGLVVHLGFAGGLDPSLPAGEAMRIAAVKNEEGRTIALDRDVPRLLRAADRPPPGPMLLTADRMISFPDQKREVFVRYQAALVDMETFSAAEAAAELSLPFIAIRAVSDPADAELPAAAAGWVRPDGRNNLHAVLRWVVAHPTRLGVLLRLGSSSRAAGASLASAAAEILDAPGR